MKRPLEFHTQIDGDTKMKKVKEQENQKLEEEEQRETDPKCNSGNGFSNLGEDLLFEVLKHADARTLGRAACVNKQWKKTALDERLWELICTRHWANIGCGNQQLRSVVLALGGFRTLHSQCVRPLSKPSAAGASGSGSTSGSGLAPLTQMMGGKQPTKWGKYEVNVFLSLLSIRRYGEMNGRGR